GISNPTTTLKVLSADQVEPVVSLTVESDILTTIVATSTTEAEYVVATSGYGEVLWIQNQMLDYGFKDTFGVEADLSNMEASIPVSPTPTFRIHKDHPKSQIVGPVDTPVQTRHKSKNMEEQSFIATNNQKTNPKFLQFCLFLCFLSQEEPKKIFDALKDPSWVESMQEELLQFKVQNAWVLDDCPKGVRPIGTKWVLKNKKDERGMMDVKSAFLYRTIDEEVYVMQPPIFQDPKFPDRVYKVEKAIGVPLIRHCLSERTKEIFACPSMLGQLILPWTKRILREKMDLVKM
nr:hypothetical protein [Tanacetum cinerariifolium]